MAFLAGYGFLDYQFPSKEESFERAMLVGLDAATNLVRPFVAGDAFMGYTMHVHDRTGQGDGEFTHSTTEGLIAVGAGPIGIRIKDGESPLLGTACFVETPTTFTHVDNGDFCGLLKAPWVGHEGYYIVDTHPAYVTAQAPSTVPIPDTDVTMTTLVLDDASIASSIASATAYAGSIEYVTYTANASPDANLAISLEAAGVAVPGSAGTLLAAGPVPQVRHFAVTPYTVSVGDSLEAIAAGGGTVATPVYVTIGIRLV